MYPEEKKRRPRQGRSAERKGAVQGRRGGVAPLGLAVNGERAAATVGVAAMPLSTSKEPESL